MRKRPLFSLLAGFFTAVAISSSHAQQIVEGEELIPSGSIWEYLLYSTNDGGTLTAADPGTVDDDFHTTWQTSADYDGPGFLSGGAPLGYEAAAADDLGIVTDVWNARDGNVQPPSGQRYTVYFRQGFQPIEDVTMLRISGITDDGAIIYLNGVRIADTGNFAEGAEDAWDLVTTGTGSETAPVTVDVPLDATLPMGTDVEIAVSLHNQSPTSSDVGMNFRVVATNLQLPTPPPNDNFADAIEIDNTALPVTVTGRVHDDLPDPRGPSATLEPNEPQHPSGSNQASVWYSFTPTESGPLQLTAAASSLASLIAVYTGTAVDDLTLVAAAADDVPFYQRAVVFIDAVAGTTYHIAISAEDDGSEPVDGEDFGTARLTISVPTPLFTEISTLLPAGSDWRYLLAAQENTDDPPLPNQPFDPATLDPDFHTTWQTAAGYNGPDFSDPVPALLGYGVILADPVITDIWGARDTDGDPETDDLVPPTGLRYAAYFRTTFTPTGAVEHLGFRGLIDDGAEIYIDGVRVSMINYFEVDGNWQGGAATAAGTEDRPQESVALNVNLPANVEVEIAVAMHNNAPTSSDMGFDLEVYSIADPMLDYGKDLSVSDPLVAGFDSAAAASMSGLGDGGPEDSLAWTSTSGTTEAESGLPNPPTPATGNALYVNNGRIDFVSGNVDLAGMDNSQVVATIDFRAFENSDGSNFETADNIQAFIEISLDTVNFVRLADILPVRIGGGEDPDDLKVLELDGGTYTTFRSNAGVIPVDARTMRVVIAGVNNSNSEHFFVDNVRIGTDLGPPPAFNAFISRDQGTGQNTITWDSDGVSTYTVFYSVTDIAGWTQIRTGSGISSFIHTPPTTDGEGFYRVEKAN